MMRGLNGNHMIMVAVACAIALALTMAMSRAGETPIYGPDGKYQGSVFDYGKTQTYTDRSGQFTGSAINNGNGTTSFYGRNGNFTGPARVVDRPGVQLREVTVSGRTIGNLILMTLICVVGFIVFMAVRPTKASAQNFQREAELSDLARPYHPVTVLDLISPEAGTCS